MGNVSRAAMILVTLFLQQSFFVPSLSLPGVSTICGGASYTFCLKALNNLVVDTVANPDEFGECVLCEHVFKLALETSVSWLKYLHCRDTL